MNGSIGGARRAPWLAMASTLLVILGASACASSGTAAPRFAPGPPRASGGAQYEVGSAELARLWDAPSMLAALERVRPRFLAPRPGWSAVRGLPPDLHVFINGLHAGAVDVLQTLPVRDVVAVRFLPPTQAQTYPPSQVGDGIILVTLKRVR